MEDGVYVITVRREQAVPGPIVEPLVTEPRKRVERIHLNWVDGSALAKALGGTAMNLGVRDALVFSFPSLSVGGGFGNGFGNSGTSGLSGSGLNGAAGTGFPGSGQFGSGLGNTGTSAGSGNNGSGMRTGR